MVYKLRFKRLCLPSLKRYHFRFTPLRSKYPVCFCPLSKKVSQRDTKSGKRKASLPCEENKQVVMQHILSASVDILIFTPHLLTITLIHSSSLSISPHLDSIYIIILDLFLKIPLYISKQYLRQRSEDKTYSVRYSWNKGWL